MKLLAQLLSTPYPLTTSVAIRNGETLFWRDFIAAVNSTMRQLASRPEQRWALFHGDSYQFAIGLFALLHSHKTIVLPANAQAGTIDELSTRVDAFIGEFPSRAIAIATTGADDQNVFFDALKTDQPVIELMTSGSSGDAKVISKTIAQLDAELTSHDELWRDRLNDAPTLATVSHQHIYGLLWRVLLPLCSGRVFFAETFAYLETLFAAAEQFPKIVVVSSPAHLKRLPSELNLTKHAERVAAVFSSGGVLPVAAATQWHTLLKQAPIEIYGSTETGGIAWRQSPLSWLPLPGVQCDIGNDQSLWVRSPFVGGDDSIATGDTAQWLDNGGFELLGRADRIVKVEEKRVSLDDVELRLGAHPWVASVHALLLDGERAQIGIVAELSVAGREALIARGKHAFDAALREYLLQFFERVVLPRKYRYVEQLPINAQGKIARAQMKALFIEAELLPGAVMEFANDSALIEIDLALIPSVFDGHFPNLPLLAGVMQLDWAARHSQQLLVNDSAFAGIEQLKFQEVIHPNQRVQLRLSITREHQVAFSFKTADKMLSSGKIIFRPHDDA